METLHATVTQTALLAGVCGRVRELLEKGRLEVQSEIVKYPPPIPACDAHFNHLLELRGRIADELLRIDGIAAGGLASAEAVRRIDEFLRDSRCLDDEARREMMESIVRAVQPGKTNA